MDKKKPVSNAEELTLPPSRLEHGNIPSPEPEWCNQANQQTLKPGCDVEGTVKRIIAHLEDE